MTDGGTGEMDRRIRTRGDLRALAFDDDGLVPVVAQDAEGGRVLMVAWANAKALERTLETGELHFWSRSRGELWRKGGTSGNVQRLVSLHADCDADTVLARVEPAGPACHTGDESCFGWGSGPEPPPAGEATARGDVLDALWRTLEGRSRERPEGSYTTRLLEDENLRLKKLGEEGAELLAGLARGDRDRIPEEAADLVYHLLVALLASGVHLDDVRAVLEGRRS